MINILNNRWLTLLRGWKPQLYNRDNARHLMKNNIPTDMKLDDENEDDDAEGDTADSDADVALTMS